MPSTNLSSLAVDKKVFNVAVIIDSGDPRMKLEVKEAVTRFTKVHWLTSFSTFIVQFLAH